MQYYTTATNFAHDLIIANTFSSTIPSKTCHCLRLELKVWHCYEIENM